MADALVKAPADLTSPRNAKFTAKTPTAGSGEQGADQLVSLSSGQCSPGSVTGSDFKTAQNSNESGKSLGVAVSVDFGTGTHSSPDQKR